MAKITDTGIAPVTLSEYKQRLTDIYLGIDPDWNLDSNSPDGQFITIISQMLYELDQEQIKTFAYRDPRQAKGKGLEDLGALQDQKRLSATQSEIDFTLDGTAGNVVKANSQIVNETTGSVWSLSADTTIGDVGHFISDDYGPITASGKFSPVFVGAGWSGVSNPQNIVIGRDEEKDGQFERRRKATIASTSRSMRESIYGAVMNLTGIIDCVVIENEEDTTVEGLPPHSVKVIALGADDLDICKAINSKISLGCKTVGSIEHVITTDEDRFGMPRRFDRPTAVDVYVKITIKGGAVISQNLKDAAAEEIVDYSQGASSGVQQTNKEGFGIGDSPAAGSIYTPVNMVMGEFFIANNSVYIEKIELSRDNVSFGNVVNINKEEMPIFSTANIQWINS